MEKARPFFNHSITQLEQEFDDRLSDREYLALLKHELSYRSTDRAKKLANRLESILTSSSQSRDHVNIVTQSADLNETTVANAVKRQIFDVVVKQVPVLARNSAEGILSSWIALEVLSPQTFKKPEDLASMKDPRLVVSLSRGRLPWEGEGEKSKPNYKLYYQIVIGAIDAEKAVGKLLEIYSDTRIERPAIKGEAIIATAVVNQKGQLIDDDSVAVSSFAWGVPQALTGDLSKLSNWVLVEASLNEYLLELLRRTDEEGNIIPINYTAIVDAQNKIVDHLGLSKELVRDTRFAIRAYQHFTFPDPPEPLLLNSFYVNDLSTIRQLFRDGDETRNLKLFLGLDSPPKKLDILNNTDVLQSSISPSKIPVARWPGPGRHPLVVLQQSAVNLAMDELKADGILAVNGPPGTGKTTLLRDLVAGIVAERAKAMCSFDNPEDAFISSGQKINAGNGWLHLYKLDPRLKGFEILIASSNNKAVENVSAELPGVKAIAEDAAELRYFNCMSNALLERDTWGVISAVLGNATNRSKFRQKFFWDKEIGINTYLQEISGTPQIIEETNDQGEKIKRKPRIVIEEDAPSDKMEARQRWHNARASFVKILQTSQSELTKLVEMEETVGQLPLAEQKELEAMSLFDDETRKAARLKEQLDQSRIVKGLELDHGKGLQDKLSKHKLFRPGFFARLFRTKRAAAWIREHRQLVDLHKQQLKKVVQLSDAIKHMEYQLQASESETRRKEQLYFEAQKAHRLLKDEVARISQHLGDHLIDAAFFSKKREVRHLVSPWCNSAMQRIRDDVFAEAMKLHKAFIDASASRLRHNLGALMMLFSGRTFDNKAKTDLVPDLWSSLFLVVPSVSSTFASVERMLHSMPGQSLGWLLADEAGQALPQAMVGALWRTRRAVVVGDPLQIEPLVVLPSSLTHHICKTFSVDPDRFNAPDASVQTLVDAASPYFAEFQARVGSRIVGVPLLVHRRCAEPMFGISNATAYQRLMVFAKTPGQSAIKKCLGPSAWLDVSGTSREKWCPEEGIKVLELLKKLKKDKIIPDLYIISPFVVVAEQLRVIVKDSGVLTGWVTDDKWIFERISTVHTVQGREAEAVIFVLGAQEPGQVGARNWAGSRPNILNVAVTRAKEVLYVVGNKKLWSGAGVFSELANGL